MPDRIVFRVETIGEEVAFTVIEGEIYNLKTKKRMTRSGYHDLTSAMEKHLLSYYMTVQRGSDVAHCYLWGGQAHNDVFLYVEYGSSLQRGGVQCIKKITGSDEREIRHIPDCFDMEKIFKLAYRISGISPENFEEGDIITIQII